MGSYTATQQYYLIDGTELVNVDQDINYNWNRADDRVRPLVEYAVTDVPTVTTSSIPKDTGFKFYKTYTNCIYVQRSDGILYQDSNCRVDSWSPSGITWETGYGPVNTDVDNVAYQSFNNFGRLRGKFWLNSGASNFPANTVTKFMTLPTSMYPTTAKYIAIYGPTDASNDFNYAKLYIPNSAASDKRLEFIYYGSGSTVSANRWLSLNDILYALDT